MEVDDETLEKILEAVEETVFDDDSAAEAFFQKKLEEMQKFKYSQKPPKKAPLANDPISQILRYDNPEYVQSRLSDEFVMSNEELHQEMERQEANVGRYPIGFRHYENYEFYALAKPDATIDEYHQEMNRQCEFSDFMGIMRAALIDQSKDPGFRWKHGLDGEDEGDVLPMEDFVLSEEFETEMVKLYQTTLRDHLIDKKYFKLIDCLEETVNFWTYGREIAKPPPSGGIYTPVRHTIMPKPKMNARDDEFDYRYNLHKLSPVSQLSSLKAYKMSPAPKEKDWSGLFLYRTRKKWVKDRRLSHSKFSTLDKNFSVQN